MLISILSCCLLLPIGCSNDDIIDNVMVADIENPIVKEYISNVVYDDDDYSYTKVLDYCNIETDWDKSYPLPVHILINNEIIQGLRQEGIESLTIQTFKDDILFREDVCELNNDLSIYNLIPNQKYHYYVSYIDSEGISHSLIDGDVFVRGQFRAIYVEGMHNIRDIGGYETTYGKRVKYDKLFRSAELQRKANPAQGDITPKGINELLYNLKIGVELDFGDENTESPVQEMIEFMNARDYKISSYNIALNPDSLGYTGDRIRNCFDLILNRLQLNQKVLFHCNAGADRTGTLAFILEALLGVSESDLAKDYEITSFFKGYIRRRDVDWVADRGSGYPAMIDYIKTNFEGQSLNEKVENMMLSFGISYDQIDAFRQIMLEEQDDTPTTIQNLGDSKIDDNSTKSDIIPIYNLAGIRTKKEKRGVHVVKGNKIMVK